MAVVQISRIQIRRGQANTGSGLPQLASGEMAWAVDTQELYIGNGSVAEGSPGVGNTKVLTQNDINASGNFLDLLEYSYRLDEIQTGPTATSPVVRTIQQRLDDRVSATEFGVVGDGIVDDTAALQRAINQLFVNPTSPSYGSSTDAIRTRIILELPAGKYKLTATLYIPSYANIVGAGKEKTILSSSVAGTAIQFVHDGYPTAWDNSALTQPRHILLKGISVLVNNADRNILQLNSVSESRFENLYLGGTYSGTFNANSIGIAMTAFSDTVNCYHNIFKDIKIYGCSYAVFSRDDINENVFEDCIISNVRQGYVFGFGANGSSIGQRFGPRNTRIERNVFGSVRQHAVYVNLGSSNIIRNSNVTDAGADGGNVSFTQYPQIYFNTTGNSAVEITSSRPSALANANLTVPYVPEVAFAATAGGKYESYVNRRFTLANVTSSTLAFRLPLSCTVAGVPNGSVVYVIDYSYKSTNNAFTRRGTMTVSVNVGTAPTYVPFVQLSDDYDFAGNDTSEKSIKLSFTAAFLDAVGAVYIATPGQVPSSLGIYYINSLAGDSGSFSYTYKAIL